MSVFKRRKNQRAIKGFVIKKKSDSLLMSLIAPFVKIYSPRFMSHYSTIVGPRIYLADEISLHDQSRIEEIILHEAVHAKDASSLTWPIFIALYLFPQVLVMGVFTWPWLGIQALWFLIFVLPFPAPFRFIFEARAYAVDAKRSSNPALVIGHFISECKDWSYYRMWPFAQSARKRILKEQRKL